MVNGLGPPGFHKSLIYNNLCKSLRPALSIWELFEARKKSENKFDFSPFCPYVVSMDKKYELVRDGDMIASVVKSREGLDYLRFLGKECFVGRPPEPWQGEPEFQLEVQYVEDGTPIELVLEWIEFDPRDCPPSEDFLAGTKF
jgi:hypothetical protein